MMAEAQSSQVRVALVDDQALFRAGIRMLIESQPDLTCVGEASDGDQAIDVVRAARPDVVLMDVRMPGRDGLAATEAILSDPALAAEGAPKIVVLTTFDLDEAAARAIRAGASGFLLKDSEPELLLAAIRTVAAGNVVFASNATQRLMAHYTPVRKPVPAEWSELTDRERDVFVSAVRGLSNAEIASALFLSEATVKTHLGRILAKLGLRDRVQLVVWAYEHGLAGDDERANSSAP